VDGARTRGQPAALGAIAVMIHGPAPHAILLTGPDGVGKTTLALDLAAGLLCEAEPERRPCRTCRACRMVDHGGHPDLHRLGPVGPGRQVVIGGPDAPYRGIRDLLSELALMPVEGRARVAIVDGADRMNEDAQSALLKTLEEPPAGVVIVLCADQEMRLLPTVRSRCARVRLGLVGARDIETIVGDHGLADPPMAARLGRLAAGRPGLALAYARAPEAVLIRAELSRVLLDLTEAGAATRLAAVRAAIPRALALVTALVGADDGRSAERTTRRRGRPAPAATSTPGGDTDDGSGDGSTDDPGDGRSRLVAASERRRAAEVLIGLWADVARDLALVGTGGARSVRDPVLLEELSAAATVVDPAAVSGFLERAARGAELLASNASPELLLDSLALAWPRRWAA
jgi:DNA polymerase III delta' subunit